jgi:drug/metabolite transporter (DMT)-like permease
MKTQIKMTVYGSLGLAILALGTNAIVIDQAQAPGMVTTFYRMLIPTLLLAPLFVYRYITLKQRITANQIILSLIAGFFFGADMVMWSTGLKISGPTFPTLFANTAPIWVGIGAYVIFKEKLNQLFFIGLIFAVSGAGLIFGERIITDFKTDIGMILGMGAGLFYACFFLTAQKVRKDLDTIQFFWISTAGSTLFILLVNIIFKNNLIDYSLPTYGAFLYTGIISQLLTWTLLNYTLGYLPASLVSPTLLLQPVLTALISSVFFGEQILAIQIAGGIVVLSGILLVHYSKRKKND